MSAGAVQYPAAGKAGGGGGRQQGPLPHSESCGMDGQQQISGVRFTSSCHNVSATTFSIPLEDCCPSGRLTLFFGNHLAAPDEDEDGIATHGDGHWEQDECDHLHDVTAQVLQQQQQQQFMQARRQLHKQLGEGVVMVTLEHE